ncbi:hypothetical protein J4771_00940 [Candidatus Kaistella beijingensis]|uniref:hypothetical protein n=1 Tax=Candidatus Kaistella beijingensis TaxID=2820270 RepID=UPI001CC50F12|nr:hypothetical protein [Candidatus Kaistella beijingensis]UBB89949.1 hypothetical protein J4771_00940 [Candidatus Kaistella beijingensis]
MKKIFLLTILLFPLTFAFGQVVSATPQYGNNWTTSACYSGISYRLSKANYNKTTGDYLYSIQFKNSYSKAIRFEFVVRDNINDCYDAIKNSSTQNIIMQANSTSIGGGTDNINAKNGGGQVVLIGNLVFEGTKNNFTGTAEKCDGGGICPICATVGTSKYSCPNYPSSNNSINNQNTQPTTTTRGSQNQTNQSQHNQANQVTTTQQSTEIPQQQPLTDYNNTIKDFMQSIPNVQESKETLDKMKNFELAKLDIEPEFNTISSPNDYNKVSLTTINYQNLDKKGNVAVSIITSALSNVDKAKDKAFSSAKIQTVFLGANTLLVKVIEIGGKTLGGPYTYPTTDVFGIAYSDKKINFEIFKQFIEINKNFKIAKCLSHKVNSNDIKTEKCGKNITISDVTKKDDKVKITANVDGITETYTVINFNSNGFTLMNKVEEDSKRAKLYNYMIEIQ